MWIHTRSRVQSGVRVSFQTQLRHRRLVKQTTTAVLLAITGRDGAGREAPRPHVARRHGTRRQQVCGRPAQHKRAAVTDKPRANVKWNSHQHAITPKQRSKYHKYRDGRSKPEHIGISAKSTWRKLEAPKRPAVATPSSPRL